MDYTAPSNWVKCNTDGAWSGTDMRGGTGWVLRDHNGDVIWLGAQAIRMGTSVLEVELEAIRGALAALSRLNYDSIILESDSLGAINLINSSEIWPVFAPMLQDIQDLLHNFKDLKLVFSLRDCNKVADRVARESLSFENYDPKLYSLEPSWIKRIVMEDKTLVS